MNHLELELDRLYGLGAGAAKTQRQGGSRVLVLEVALPAGWEQLSSAWKGAQTDLGLPAPAIAVSGADGLQLWFSLASPVSPVEGAQFLRGLCARYLPDLASKRVRWISETAQLPATPPFEIGPDRWSAFVAPDLAAVFADTPWLDIRPNGEGQATLLRALEPIRQAAFEAALHQLGAAEGTGSPESTAPAPSSAPPAMRAREHGGPDPEHFLRSVMNNETVPLALRIEAAKALLPHVDRS